MARHHDINNAFHFGRIIGGRGSSNPRSSSFGSRSRDDTFAPKQDKDPFYRSPFCSNRGSRGTCNCIRCTTDWM